ncbi:hypothetical protein [Tumebacillus permanentifrigoris]|uniref:Uncharacterized protein n=1 Tax=Tumebacillus permanentifrigoris TaxID=378543 RepID=A0A316DBK9_9BACL|nr:hypothetical protein [Tumebacillus permanentifrigoris]PWK15581.1 hypothetical protein C7459_103118 [Tumebacillus permanentifrigoris]
MGSSMVKPIQVVTVRWGNEDEEKVFKIKGILVSEKVVLAIFDGDVEIHFVAPTDDLTEFELIQCFGPIFRVGDNKCELPAVFEDLHKLSVVDFARKYPHSEMLDYLNENNLRIPGLNVKRNCRPHEILNSC